MQSSRPVIDHVKRTLVLAMACVASVSYAGFTNNGVSPDARANPREEVLGMALSGHLEPATWSAQVGLMARPSADGPAAACVCMAARHDTGASRSLGLTMDYVRPLDGSGVDRRAGVFFVRRF
jgi:hypothetical protein